MPNPSQIAEFAAKHPTLLAALAGGATGAGVGAATSDEGEELRGAVGGGALGAGFGALGGTVADKVRSAIVAMTPSQQKALIAGGVTAGGIAGYHGRAALPAWVKRRLMTQSDVSGRLAAGEDETSMGLNEKGAQDMSDANKNTSATDARDNLTKQAEMEKESAERLAAFDFGMDLFCAEGGLEKAALAKAYGIEDVTELAPRATLWLNNEAAQEAQK